MINKISYNTDKIHEYETCHNNTQYSIPGSKGINIVYIVNDVILGTVNVESSSIISIAREPERIEIYKGHGNSVTFNLVSYNMYDIDVNDENNIVNVIVKTNIRENK